MTSTIRKTVIALVTIYLAIWLMTFVLGRIQYESYVSSELSDILKYQGKGGMAIRLDSKEDLYVPFRVKDKTNIYYYLQIRSYAPFHINIDYAQTVQGTSSGTGSRRNEHLLWLFGERLRRLSTQKQNDFTSE